MSEELHHGIIMEDRKKLNASGVREIVEYSEDGITLKTDMGVLTVRGENLHIGAFNTETGDLTVHGGFYAFVYTDDRVKKEGFFSRIFK